MAMATWMSSLLERSSARLWFNDGAGHFRPDDQRIEYRYGGAVAVGDVDGDGTVDALVVGEGVYQLWRNDGRGQFTADTRFEFLED